jgi:hypothetical protein
MTFLNGMLLGGLAAVSIPVIIHLFNRSRFRVVRWGAMHLLEGILKKNRRRLKLEQIILLIVRCAIPALLALLMARPVLTGWEPLLGQAKTSTIVLLDNSYSMEAGPKGSTSFEQARETARRILDAQVEGSDAGLLPMAGGPPVEPTFELDRLRGELSSLAAGYGAADVPAALGAAQKLLPKLHHPVRDVVVLSDFQRVSWSEAETAARARQAQLLHQGRIAPTVTFFSVGAETRQNVCVESLDPGRLVLGVGQTLRLRAALRNHGETAYPELAVVFLADGVERDVQRIPLGAGETSQLFFTYRFEKPGSHVLEVRAAADPLEADNRMMIALPVWDRLSVVLVNGDPSPEPLKGETDFAEIALRPFGAARTGLADLIDVRTLEPAQVAPAALAEARVVLLANVARLADPALKALENFVRDGGGLLIFPGDRIDGGWYGGPLADGGRGLLPQALVGLGGSLAPDAAPASIVAQRYTHPALELFNDPGNGSLAEARIRLWTRTREATDPGTTILARLDSGDPFLIEKAYGGGRVIQCAVPCDLDWSNLPLRPFYLPLLQQLVTYLAARAEPPRNLKVGAPLTALLPAADAGKTARLTDPAGRAGQVPIIARGGRAVAETTDTRLPGLYVLEPPAGQKIHFVVNTDRAESDLRRLGAAELEQAAAPFKAAVVDSWSDYQQRERQRRFGREIWQWALTGLLIFLFAELLLQQWFSRSKAR